MEAFAGTGKAMPQRGAAGESGMCDPSFCRTYRVYLESEDLGGQADSGKAVTQPAEVGAGGRGGMIGGHLVGLACGELWSLKRTPSPSVRRLGG